MNGGDQQAQGMGRVVYVSDPSNTTALYSDPAQPDELRQWVRNLAAGGVDTYVEEVRRVWYEQGRPAWRGRAIGAYTECELALTGPPAVPGDNYLGLTLEKAGPDGDDDIVVEELEVIVNVR